LANPTSDSITGTSTSTPTTVANAAPECRPNNEIATANAVGLQQQGYGNQHNRLRLTDNSLCLEPEQQHYRRQQPHYRPGFQAMQETVQPLLVPACLQAVAGNRTGSERQHDINHHRQQQCLPGHVDIADPKQKCGNRREGEHHDDIVDRHLHQGVIGISPGQGAPYKNHCRTGRNAQQDHARDILTGALGVYPVHEEHPEEQVSQRSHGEGLDQPVHHQGEDQTLRSSTDIPDGREIDLHHHRVDHHPDKYGDNQVDVGELQP
jgi:hypothetical protein